jgi:hypothetical protein
MYRTGRAVPGHHFTDRKVPDLAPWPGRENKCITRKSALLLLAVSYELRAVNHSYERRKHKLQSRTSKPSSLKGIMFVCAKGFFNEIHLSLFPGCTRMLEIERCAAPWNIFGSYVATNRFGALHLQISLDLPWLQIGSVLCTWFEEGAAHHSICR